MKTMKQNKRIDFYVELKGKKLYLVSTECNPIQLKIDITSVWHFVEAVLNHQPNNN